LSRGSLRLAFQLALGIAFTALASLPADAVPIFAHEYGVSCQTCHTMVPRLNAFGEAFERAGYRWPAKVATRRAFPVAMKVNFAYSSQPDLTGLPKAIVDEVELLMEAPVGLHFTYRLEQYVVDGGRPGNTRDAYVAYNSDPMSAWIPGGPTQPVVGVQAGQFTLPLPVDPETMRPTENHYAIFDQTVGQNPFNLFDDRIGLNVSVGNRFAEFNELVLKGHDPQSGLPTDGTDIMLAGRVGPEALSVSGYQYDGNRPLAPTPDIFWRRGFALTSITGKSRLALLAQTGYDSSADGLGNGVPSSGGFLQEEWAFSERLIGVARYDSTSDSPSGMARSMTLTLNFRPYDRARLTVEGVIGLGRGSSNAFNAAWLFAY
jgi:hypothetical protein